MLLWGSGMNQMLEEVGMAFEKTHQSKVRKPPPIRVGVPGIEQPERIDWRRVIALPAFQQFAAERSGHEPAEVDRWMPNFLRMENQRIGAQGLFDTYCVWHERMGRWPGESPLGDIVDA